MITIYCAAVLQDGIVYSLPRPARHHNIRDYMINELGMPKPQPRGETGFLTSAGKFVDNSDDEDDIPNSQQYRLIKISNIKIEKLVPVFTISGSQRFSICSRHQIYDPNCDICNVQVKLNKGETK